MIRTAFQHADHATAVDVAVVGRRVGGQHLDLLQGLRRRAVGDDVVERFIQVNAVERVIICLRAIAVQVHTIGVGIAAFNAGRAGGANSAYGARNIKRERRKIQAVQRKVLNGIGREGTTQGSVRCVEDRGRVRDRHRLRGTARIQLQIEGRRLQRFKLKGWHGLLPEAGRLDRDLITADGQKRDPVEAGSVRGGGRVDPGLKVVRDDRSARDHRATRVGDVTRNSSGDGLRQSGSSIYPRRGQRSCQHAQPACSHVSSLPRRASRKSA